jgi:hypothetical protein
MQDRVRAAVRVTACDLRPGDTVQPWNNRRAAHRTVAAVEQTAFRVDVRWTDGTAVSCHPRAVYHRSGVHVTP